MIMHLILDFYLEPLVKNLSAARLTELVGEAKKLLKHLLFLFLSANILKLSAVYLKWAIFSQLLIS